MAEDQPGGCVTQRGAVAAIEAIRAGELVVVQDDLSRENEGDLVMAADAVTGSAINFMITQGRGLVCVPMLGARLDELALPQMVAANRDPFQTRFSVSVDLNLDRSTGISAWDRAATILALVGSAKASDLRRPGHVFPLRYAAGGVLARRGHTEASVDLAVLAGHRPAAVICEILAPDGAMLRGAALDAFASMHGLVMVSIEELVAYRNSLGPSSFEGREFIQSPSAVVRETETVLPTRSGPWKTLCYSDANTGTNHLVLVFGDVSERSSALVRVHSECLTGDVIGSLRCDCGQQLTASMSMIAREGAGVLIYLRGHEGRGIGLLDKLRAYALQDRGLDTVDANLELGLPVDAREYWQCGPILQDLEISQVRLITNNPQKVAAIRATGIRIVSRVPLVVDLTRDNAKYVITKERRMGHHPPVRHPDRRPVPTRSGDSRIV